MPVIHPVLFATRTPGGSPVGIFSRNSWRSRIATISVRDASEAMPRSTSARITIPMSWAVVVLERPAWDAGISSTAKNQDRRRAAEASR